MIDEIGEPVFLTRFPAAMKSFYMQRCADDERLTESVDLLVPGVGEVAGGSMRLYRYEDTLRALERQGLDKDQYYWYTDIRKYGAAPHGGCGVGVDRLCCWLLGVPNIRDVVMYPRLEGQLMP